MGNGKEIIHGTAENESELMIYLCFYMYLNISKWEVNLGSNLFLSVQLKKYFYTARSYI